MNLANVRFLPRVVWGSVLALLLGLTMVVSAARDGEAALSRSDAAFDAGNTATALREAHLAAASSVPLASHTARADARIRAIALGAEATGNPLLARQAWAALRGAALERQHPFAPEPALEEADRQLARLLAAAHDAKKERTFTEAELLAEMRDARPGLFMPLLGSGALMPLLALAAVVLWRRKSQSSPDGEP
jgi:hypothetical protein